MIRKSVMCVAALMVVSAFLTVAPSEAAERAISCRTEGGTNYLVYKEYCYYGDTTQSTCHQGQAWCTRTVHNSVKLKHTHFTEDFIVNETVNEQADADRWLEYYKGPPSPETRVDSATTTFNCHAWALGPNQNVWNEDQQTTLDNDFNRLPPCGPEPQLADRIKHVNGHSSIIVQLSPLKVCSKWGEYGTYTTGASIYGGVDSYWRPKD